jgi:exodeoxyribonuclease V alpha subunit
MAIGIMSLPTERNSVSLEGHVERITYNDQESHFTIAKLKLKGQRELVTVIGNLMSVGLGERLKIQGVYERHPKYGLQVRVERYESLAPATEIGIEKYLGSGLIKGIGPEMAKRIVQRFGLKTLEIIDKKPSQLSQVEGVGPKRITQLKKSWEAQKEIRQIMIFLQGHGITSGLAAKIFKTYGREAIVRIQENPFDLASDLFGVGFVTADRLAEKLGLAKEAPQRLEAGIAYLLQQKAEEGHTGYPREELVRQAVALLNVEEAGVEQALKDLLQGRQLQVRPGPAGTALIFLPYLSHCEEGLARRINELLAHKLRLPEGLVGEMAAVEQSLGLHLADRQRQAFETALTQKLLIITGGPGTGKTTLVRSILETFRRGDLKCVLMAPTGRAAKRLSEVTHYPAATIHRTLGYNPHQRRFLRDRGHPLEADLILIDEASMIDTVLMYHLLQGVPDRAVLILVGDVYQLPSVGPGQVLADLIGSLRIPVVELIQIFRQAEGSLIVANAHRIHQGELPLIPPENRGGNQEFYFIPQEDPEKAARWILELVGKKIPDRYALDPLGEIQVLTPMYKGAVGAENLNQLLQEGLNPGSAGLQRGPRLFKVGDKVMQVRNNYEREVFNGDLGRISKIDPEQQQVWVNFEGQFVSYEYSDLDELSLAYAISVHKSQGSEYPAVVLPVMTQHYILLQRNLIYTAVTRAKRLIVIIGTKKALAMGIRNNKTQERHTALRERLSLAGS